MIIMDITPFQQCYDKHNFEELNDIDANVLRTAMHFFKGKYAIDKNSVFFDVGTNAGSFVKILKEFQIEQNIHCFEPHPVLHKATKDLYPHIIMNNYCLSDVDGFVDIHIPNHSVALSSIIKRPLFSNLNQPIYTINVECKKIDTYCKENNIDEIDFMKIDVEGAEKHVFEGALSMLENKKIKCGMFEVVEQALKDANTSEPELCEILYKYGYCIEKTLLRDDYVFFLP